MRIPITKRMPDDTIVDGTALFEQSGDVAQIHDFRDLDGEELVLEPGAYFEVPLT